MSPRRHCIRGNVKASRDCGRVRHLVSPRVSAGFHQPQPRCVIGLTCNHPPSSQALCRCPKRGRAIVLSPKDLRECPETGNEDQKYHENCCEYPFAIPETKSETMKSCRRDELILLPTKPFHARDATVPKPLASYCLRQGMHRKRP